MYLSQCKKCLRLLGFTNRRKSMTEFMCDYNRRIDDNEKWNEHIQRCQKDTLPENWSYRHVENFFFFNSRKFEKVKYNNQ